MRIHQQKEKMNVVMDRDQLLAIAMCLSESPVLKNRLLALEIKRAMDDLNKRSKK
jgi:hypothetical protein